MTESYADDYSKDLNMRELGETSDKKKVEYHLKDYYGDDFVTTMPEYADSILKECKYSGLVQRHFNFSTFDIEVNGEDKVTSHGRGYHSCLNTDTDAQKVSGKICEVRPAYIYHRHSSAWF